MIFSRVIGTKVQKGGQIKINFLFLHSGKQFSKMACTTFPPLFLESLHGLLPAAADALLDALQQTPPISIRYNEKKSAPPASAQTQRVPWCSQGVYLAQRPAFTLDPLLHAGTYYVQEASSMFLAQLASLIRDRGSACRVLDLCAAPGGKSTLLSGLLPPEALLVSNEVIRSRAHILVENLSKWGRPETVVTNNDPKRFGTLPGFFDVMLVDAPCSGEGMFRKDPAAVKEWSPANVRLCAERQRRIVTDAWDALQENGLLVYSTCTFNRQENEENVQWFMQHLGAERMPLPFDPAWGIVESDFGYRFYPHRVRGEGFFVSVLRKTQGQKPFLSKVKNTLRKLPAKAVQPAASWLSGDFVISEQVGFISALPTAQQSSMAALSERLTVLQAGIPLGEQKGNTVIPAAALALSTALQPAAFPRAEVDLPAALRFLHRDTIILPDEEKGFVLLTYKHTPLGFVKNIGHRTNNLYPAAWRIKMDVV
jgi:16S rRNA C967 or C1407 C5-methylase (RsmB/RsmF family)/NOL1/NOP2/fmu family ribosome biogenesis protein